MNVTIIVPSLNPDEKLEQVAHGLIDAGYKDIVIVNDGSDSEHMQPFLNLEKLSQCTILTHEVNKGKGRALKTAFSYIVQNRKDVEGVVTVDGDNQHQVKDITACAQMMIEDNDTLILGCRDFSGKDVPLRSKFGNKFTSFVFRTACGVNISDTQTGLRGIPFGYLNDMISIEGERFEYETNMLLSLKALNIPYKEHTIQTVYIAENETSHFNPIVDSIKIYKVILKFIFSSMAASLIDIVLFSVFITAIGSLVEPNMKVFVATFAARAISSMFNCIFNKRAVFKSNAPFFKILLKYYSVCIVQTMVSYLSVSGFSTLLSIEGGPLMVLTKIIVDLILFFVSFKVQRAWVYKE